MVIRMKEKRLRLVFSIISLVVVAVFILGMIIAPLLR